MYLFGISVKILQFISKSLGRYMILYGTTNRKPRHCSVKFMERLEIYEDSSCKEEKVEDFILKPEKHRTTKKLRAASPLSLSIFLAKR